MKKIKTIFTYFDCDNSNVLSPTEIQTGLKNLKLEIKCKTESVEFRPNNNCVNVFV